MKPAIMVDEEFYYVLDEAGRANNVRLGDGKTKTMKRNKEESMVDFQTRAQRRSNYAREKAEVRSP